LAVGRSGVCVSADSAAREAEALLNIDIAAYSADIFTLLVRASFSVRTLRFSPVSALAAAAAVALALAREFSVK
jgi:hypothetical protein